MNIRISSLIIVFSVCWLLGFVNCCDALQESLLSERFADENWFDELDFSNGERAKMRVWRKRQNRKFREAVDGWKSSRQVGQRELVQQVIEGIVEQDHEFVWRMLDENQKARFEQLLVWHEYRIQSTDNIIRTMCSARIYEYLGLDATGWSEFKTTCRREELVVLEEHEADLRELRREMISPEVYDRLHQRGYVGVRLQPPFQSIETLESFVANCNGPRSKLQDLKDIRDKAILAMTQIQEADSVIRAEDLERQALEGAYEQVDKLLIDMKFDRLSGQFLRNSLSGFGFEYDLNPDAIVYFGLDKDTVQKFRTRIAEAQNQFNLKYVALQRSQYRRFQELLDDGARAKLEKDFGAPPQSKLSYYRQMSASSSD
jgi:hypothetical protein